MTLNDLEWQNSYWRAAAHVVQNFGWQNLSYHLDSAVWKLCNRVGHFYDISAIMTISLLLADDWRYLRIDYSFDMSQ